MKPEAQRVAIAEACGWRRNGKCVLPCENKGKPLFFHDRLNRGGLIDSIPDYLNDLNAMHEAEKGLIFSKRQAFRIELQRVMSRQVLGIDFCAVEISECIHATAPQRAEAFLRTLNLWTNEP